jgi:hypothetical protein
MVHLPDASAYFSAMTGSVRFELAAGRAPYRSSVMFTDENIFGVKALQAVRIDGLSVFKVASAYGPGFRGGWIGLLSSSIISVKRLALSLLPCRAFSLLLLFFPLWPAWDETGVPDNFMQKPEITGKNRKQENIKCD